MARTIRIKLFKFHELSDKAKEKAIEQYRDKGYEPAWTEENRKSMEAFAEVFPIHVKDWSYGGRGEGVSFYFTDDYDLEKLSGQRLATYLWNNYRGELYKKKYYGHLRITDEWVNHRRIQSKQLNTGPNKGKYSNAYYSGVTIVKSTPFTGYYMDDVLCEEIWNYIDKPDSRTFKELLQDCFNNWIKACNDDVEDQNSDEYISDTLSANDYEFTKDGKQY